ncbi:hypothetical protein ACFFRR_011657 [Megaselia abdita]
MEPNGNYKTKIEFLNALEKVGIDKVNEGQEEYKLVVGNARYRRSLWTNDYLRTKLSISQLNYFHNHQKLQRVDAVCAINLTKEHWDEVSRASDDLVPKMAALHSAVKAVKPKGMVPAEEVLNAEIRCLQKQRFNALLDTFDILNSKFQKSEIGRKIGELQAKIDKHREEIKNTKEEILNKKTENEQILRKKDKQVEDLIVKILLAKQEFAKKHQMKSNEVIEFEFKKPKSFRELFPQNLEEEFEKRSVYSKRPTVSKIQFKKVTESVTVSNANLSVRTKDTTMTDVISYKEDSVVKNQILLRKSAEVEINHSPSKDKQLCSNISIIPTNFQKYNYLKSVESTFNIQRSQNSLPSPSSFPKSSIEIPSSSDNPSFHISSNNHTGPKNSQSKVDILDVEILNSSDKFNHPVVDRFSSYLEQSPFSTDSSIPRKSSQFDLKSNDERKKSGQINSFDLNSGKYIHDLENTFSTQSTNKNNTQNRCVSDINNQRQPGLNNQNRSEFKQQKHRPEFKQHQNRSEFKQNEHRSEFKQNEHRSEFKQNEHRPEFNPQNLSEIKQHQTRHEFNPQIHPELKQNQNRPEQTNQRQPGLQNLNRPENNKHVPLESPEEAKPKEFQCFSSPGSFGASDNSKDNFEDFAKEFNFTNDSVDMNMGFPFGDDPQQSEGDFFKMDLDDGPNDSFCFGDETAKGEDNDNFFHF